MSLLVHTSEKILHLWTNVNIKSYASNKRVCHGFDIIKRSVVAMSNIPQKMYLF